MLLPSHEVARKRPALPMPVQLCPCPLRGGEIANKQGRLNRHDRSAPRSGKETRERIAGKAGAVKDDLDELIEKARGEWSKAKGKAGDAATMTKEEVSDFVRFLVDEAEDLKERLGRDVANSADEVADRARKAADHVRHGAN